jgi:hypothetical protein
LAKGYYGNMLRNTPRTWGAIGNMLRNTPRTWGAIGKHVEEHTKNLGNLLGTPMGTHKYPTPPPPPPPSPKTKQKKKTWKVQSFFGIFLLKKMPRPKYLVLRKIIRSTRVMGASNHKLKFRRIFFFFFNLVKNKGWFT